MKISKLHLSNFRSFADAEFIFPSQFTALIGENGKGKSALLRALRVAIGTFLLKLDEAYGVEIHKEDVRRVDLKHRFAPQLPTTLQVWGEVGDQTISWKRSKRTISGRTSYVEAATILEYAENLEMQTNQQLEEVDFPVLAYFSTARLWIGDKSPVKARIKGAKIRDEYDECLDHWREKFPALGWVKANYYKSLKEKLRGDVGSAQLDAVLEAISTCVPGWHQLEWDEDTDDLAGLYSPDGMPGTLLPLYFLSDGLRIVAGMAAEIAYRCVMLNGHLGAEAVRRSKGVILIDELDMHLHPNWQRGIVGDLKKAFPSLQFIVTTHSPFIIQSLASHELVNLDRDSDVSPTDLSLEEVAENIMGVESAYSVENRSDEKLAQQFLQVLDPTASVEDKSKNQAVLTQIVGKVSDPGLRALLQMKQLVKDHQKDK